MVRVSAEELDPYPGSFMKDDLEKKIERACTILAEQYRKDGKEADAAETLKNIEIAKFDAIPVKNTFHHLLNIKKLWEKMMEFTSRNDIKERLHHVLNWIQ